MLLSVIFACRSVNVLHVYCTTETQVQTGASMERANLLCVAYQCFGLCSTTSPGTFEIDYIDCPFSRELNTKCVQVSASGCTNIPRWTVLTSVQLRGMTLQFYAAEQGDTAKDVLLFLVQHSGIHSHCLFVIHHWHWLSSVRFWRLLFCRLQSIRNTSIAPT